MCCHVFLPFSALQSQFRLSFTLGRARRCGLATARGIPDDDGGVDRSKETPEETAARLQRESAQAQAEVRCVGGMHAELPQQGASGDAHDADDRDG